MKKRSLKDRKVERRRERVGARSSSGQRKELPLFLALLAGEGYQRSQDETHFWGSTTLLLQ